MELFTPVNKDNRGYTNCFECNSCGAYIYTASYCKEIDYNYCPYCADAGIMRLKEKVADLIKANKCALPSAIHITGISLNSLADLLRIDRETGEETDDYKEG